MQQLAHFFELSDLAKQSAAQYKIKRPLFHEILEKQGRHFIGIAGHRGVGKTILLKQLAREWQNSFYLSADTLGESDLFDLFKTLSEKYKITTGLIDEIHFSKNFEGALKKIYDFLQIRIVFTSSVSLSLFESAYDLSRRVEIMKLGSLSLCEYVQFKHNDTLPSLTLEDIQNQTWTPNHLRYEYVFEDYLKGEILPFALEEPDVMPLLHNILNTVITRDIPSVSRLHMDEPPIIEKVVRFIGRSPSEDINLSSIAKNLGITRYKAEQYVTLLEKAFVLNSVLPAGTNVLKEPKILMRLPYRLLYMDYEKAVGALREDFFAEMMSMKNIPFQYLKSTRGEKTPDFLVNLAAGPMVVEIGGKGKGRTQFKDVTVANKMVLAHGATAEGIKRPLFLLGF